MDKCTKDNYIKWFHAGNILFPRVTRATICCGSINEIIGAPDYCVQHFLLLL